MNQPSKNNSQRGLPVVFAAAGSHDAAPFDVFSRRPYTRGYWREPHSFSAEALTYLSSFRFKEGNDAFALQPFVVLLNEKSSTNFGFCFTAVRTDTDVTEEDYGLARLDAQDPLFPLACGTLFNVGIVAAGFTPKIATNECAYFVRRLEETYGRDCIQAALRQNLLRFADRDTGGQKEVDLGQQGV